MPRSVPAQLEEALSAAPAVAMATLISATGSTPKKAGAKMWVGPNGVLRGTVTIGGCVDSRVLDVAAQVLRDGRSQRITLDLGDEEAWEIGLTCGGSVEVLVERVARDDRTHETYRAATNDLDAGRPVVVSISLDDGTRRIRRPADDENAAALIASGVSQLQAVGEGPVFHEVLLPSRTVLIVGAGEVARSLVVLLHELGMFTVVIDAREHLTTAARFPQADDRRAGIPSEIVSSFPLTPSTAVVLVAHDYKYELPVLRTALRSDVGYVGMLGGKKRGSAIRDMLRDEGFTTEELGRIKSPIGLDIGARSTAEIALSIAAELVMVNSGQRA